MNELSTDNRKHKRKMTIQIVLIIILIGLFAGMLSGLIGVGGGIIAVAPGKASIAVWAPGLDHHGNSHLGRIALELLTKRLGWSIFGL